MKSTKILNTETEPLLIASLPARPNQPLLSGGRSYTSSELRAAFDKLPLLLVERFNLLLSDIGDGGICSAIPTGLDDGHSLADLINDIEGGELAWRMKAQNKPLAELLLEICERLTKLEGMVLG